MVLAFASAASAADMPVKEPLYKAPPPVLWNWTGLYVGYHTGSAMGLNNVNDPLGPSIFGDNIHSPGYFGGGQIGYNWQVPGSNVVWGIEVDESLANLDGTNTCFAFSGTFTSFNCRAHTSSFGTATARVGLAFGEFGRALAYVKGGFAWAHSNVDMIVNADIAGAVGGATTSTAFTATGATVGVGAEYALTPHWTVKAEYDYLSLGGHNVAAPGISATTNPTVAFVETLVPVPGTSVSQQIHAFKLGMNYKFGPDIAAFPSDGFSWPFAGLFAAPSGVTMPVKAPPLIVNGWAVEFGARYWYSTGRFQKDVAPGVIGAQNPTFEVSRLTWDNLNSHAGEMFGRVDTPINVFVKGFVGAGGISSGKINDEDWGIPAPFAAVNDGYSNTLGNASGNLA